MTEVSLGIDVGTGSTKVGLVDDAGRLLATGRAPHVIDEPHPGWSESDPSCWVDALANAIHEALTTVDQPVAVVAVGFSGQMHGVVVCGEDLEPLRPAVLWSDQRARPYLDELRAALTAEAGAPPSLPNPVVAGMAGPTMASLLREEPNVVAATRTILQPKDWVRHRLTGSVATDPSDGSATLLWDSDTDDWSASAARAFGVDPAWLPPVMAADEVSGTVTAAAAAAFGLPEGVPVAVGGADTAAALLGAGIGLGETQVSTGTGGQVATLLSTPTIDASGRTHLFRTVHAAGSAGGSWYAMAAMQNAGVAIDWALGLLGVTIDEAAAAVAATPIGSGGVTFLPYLTGERTPHMDASLTGRWVGLRPGTDQPALVRSVFEGVAFAMRDGLDALRSAGHEIDRALLAGGGSTAPWWQQILADALDVPLVPHDAADASVRGAGLLGWASLGRSVDPAAAVKRLAPVEPGAGTGAEVATAAGSWFDALDRFRAAAI